MFKFIIIVSSSIFLFTSLFANSIDTTTTQQDVVNVPENISEKQDNKEESTPGVLFWVSCIVAATVPWIYIYVNKQRSKK
jgi:hypothetical protein